MYAGGNEKSNGSYYLYNGQYYWTISPGGWQGGDAKVLYVSNNGASGGNPVTDAYGLRPVINLRSDVTFSGGNGTLDNPYVVQWLYSDKEVVKYFFLLYFTWLI